MRFGERVANNPVSVNCGRQAENEELRTTLKSTHTFLLHMMATTPGPYEIIQTTFNKEIADKCSTTIERFLELSLRYSAQLAEIIKATNQVVCSCYHL